MAELALAHDALLPRPPGGQGAGAALALLVHAGLIGALTISVDWRAQTPEVFAAELWASVPQAAAPPPPEPPMPAPPPPAAPRAAAPPAPDADIAVERTRERQRKAEADERKKAEAEARRLADEQKQADATRRVAEQRARDAREARAEDERLARLREENLLRMMGQATGSGGGSATGGAAQSAGPSAAYAGQVVARVRPHIVFNSSVPGNPAAEVEVTAASGGSIIARRLVKSSGHKDWDEAVLRAIDKTPSLPRDSDGRVPQTIIIAFRRE